MCIVVVIVGVGLFVPKANWGTVAILLLCPAMHLFMNHGNHDEHGGHPPSHKASEGHGKS